MSPGQWWASRVIDQDVEISEALDRGGDQVANGVVFIQITGADQDFCTSRITNLLCRLLQVGLGTATDGHLDPFLGQHLRAGPTQTLTRAANDSHLILQFQIHMCTTSSSRLRLSGGTHRCPLQSVRSERCRGGPACPSWPAPAYAKIWRARLA